MQLQFLGATDTVTGSKYLVREGKGTVLVDCGLFQGYKQLRLRNWSALPVRPDQIDAVILTHAHIDHSGYLPLLVRDGFKGHIYCTPATKDLCSILLPDCGHLLEEEAEHANQYGLSKHHPALPLYTRNDAMASLKRIKAVPPSKPWQPVSGLTAHLSPSGHMPGSAFVKLDMGGGELAALHGLTTAVKLVSFEYLSGTLEAAEACAARLAALAAYRFNWSAGESSRLGSDALGSGSLGLSQNGTIGEGRRSRRRSSMIGLP